MSKGLELNGSEIANAELFLINNATAYLSNNVDGLQFKIVTQFKNKIAMTNLKNSVVENTRKFLEIKVEEFPLFLV